MASDQDFFTLDEASTLIGKSRDAIYKKTQRYRASHGPTELIAADDEGRVIIARQLLDQWYAKPARTQHDHREAEREMLELELSSAKIELQHVHITSRDHRIAELEDQLERQAAAHTAEINDLKARLAAASEALKSVTKSFTAAITP